ncbi:endolytic transglycosylase MltG [Clostridium cylindrosporum]|uniref:Endolytic murein transglycosylase n=1 Tax=Clostridium cylindrosporum DSM 605 TaxID=1121307 RepID=A0A0J8DBL6_CLOCY|nr:endolytic transglycosylase MltG [Clostridium cylindrosporum]KMT23242.1 protein YceG-like protein [Clostridium cylindrosporum DSM 605]
MRIMNKVIIIFVILTVIVVSGFTYLHSEKFQTINKVDTYIMINEKYSLEDIANQLKEKSVIKSKDEFIKYANLFRLDDNIKKVNIIIERDDSYWELISKLKSGKSDFNSVTIPEGLTFYQIAEKLEYETKVKKEDFLKIKSNEIHSNNLISKNSNNYYELEGFLFPDTYYLPVNASAKNITNLMLNRFKSVFSEKYVNRSKELGLGISEVITIASLIEKEAANDNERSRIAGVIYNRIKKGMPLQIDAAVIYAKTKGKSSMQKVTYDDLKVQSKYNTYLYKGLPPGPIASPGIMSIKAALYPEKHDYLYYVAKDKSGHVFSKTYKEHLINVNKFIKKGNT